ncbi:hypothetical protein N8198_00670 [Gammaproteobacteria bacterium]|nr:hypothetical protein [Gammaproteobacteria bacterium]
MRYVITLILVFCTTQVQANFDVNSVSFSKVAVVIYGQDPLAQKYSRAAFTRMENILLDNGVEVLDKAEVEELKDVWKQLEDPGYFVTAETFVENTEKYAIDGMIRIYLNVDVVENWGNTFSAVAAADIRFVDNEANVEAYSSIPMGVPGKPPSDGLTRNAASVNAVQRAIDESSARLGLEIIDFARPRTMKFNLAETDAPVGETQSKRLRSDDTAFESYASKPERGGTFESFTCHDRDPAQVLGVAGGYLKITGVGSRTYGSRLHVIDLAEGKEILLFDTSLQDRKHSWEKGVRKLQDCMFIESWRYLVALTGNHISLWDTERGINMSEILLSRGIKKGGSLDYISNGVSRFIVVRRGGKAQQFFEIVR